MVPLLLLATPGRATVHVVRHLAGVDGRRPVGGGVVVAQSSATLAIPVEFADLAQSSAGAIAAITAIAAPPGPSTVVTPAGAASTTGSAPHTVNAAFHQGFPTTTTTSTTTTTVAPPKPTSPAAVPTATTPPTAARTVTSARAVARPSTSSPPPRDVRSGPASWYDTAAGTCASPTLAFGTVVTVTDLATGASVRCTVDDRQSASTGRVLDMSETTFSRLADPSVGVIEVRLSW